jgi:hypothetical protein
MERVSCGVLWLCGRVYGDLHLTCCGDRGSRRVMLAVLMDYMTVQEPLEIVKRTGGEFWSLDCSRNQMLLSWGVLGSVR